MSRGRTEKYALSEEQVKSLIEYLATRELDGRFIIKVLLYLGFRASELVHLNASWVREDQVHVPPEQWCSCYECRARGKWTPKTQASIRSLPIAKPLRADLYAYLGKYPDGLSVNRAAIWKRVKRMLKEANIITKGAAGGVAFPHALRATCATILASGGIEASALCYYMAWNNLETAQHYIQLAQSRKRASDQALRIFSQNS